MFQSLAEHKTNPNPMNLASNYHGFMGNITLFFGNKVQFRRYYFVKYCSKRVLKYKFNIVLLVQVDLLKAH